MDYQAAANIIDRYSGLYDITTSEGTERRRLFYSTQGNICEFARRSRKRGYIIPQSTVANWLGLAKVVKPETNIVEKFRRYASRATFPSAFVRKCLMADPHKGLLRKRPYLRHTNRRRDYLPQSRGASCAVGGGGISQGTCRKTRLLLRHFLFPGLRRHTMDRDCRQGQRILSQGRHQSRTEQGVSRLWKRLLLSAD